MTNAVDFDLSLSLPELFPGISGNLLYVYNMGGGKGLMLIFKFDS